MVFPGRALAPALVLIAAGCAGGGAGTLGTFEDSAAYALGANLGMGLKQQAPDIRLEQVIAGVREAFETGEAGLSQQEMQALLQRYARMADSTRQARMAVEGDANVAAGQEFLEQNANRPEVTVTASGLQYEVVEQADGPRPGATDRVSVHYRGTLVDGTEFDATDWDGDPVTFPLNQVIAGWTEGVQLMSVGSTYKFYVPGNLAYGPVGSPPDIGPNATLIFDVKLVGIEN